MNSKLKLGLISIGAVIGIFLLGFIFSKSFENTAITLEEQVETSMSDIQVQEKRRVDLVYNLADCVKQYDAHEAETLKDIVSARSGSKVENATTAIQAVSEAYPELKSDKNYKQLMTELSTTENLISTYRSAYNKDVKQYKRYVRKFPASFFLNLNGYEIMDYDYLEYKGYEDAPQNIFD